MKRILYAIHKYFAYYRRVATVPTVLYLRKDWAYFYPTKVKFMLDEENKKDRERANKKALTYWKAYHPKEAYQMKKHNTPRNIIWAYIFGTLVGQYLMYFKFFWWLILASEHANK